MGLWSNNKADRKYKEIWKERWRYRKGKGDKKDKKKIRGVNGGRE